MVNIYWMSKQIGDCTGFEIPRAVKSLGDSTSPSSVGKKEGWAKKKAERGERGNEKASLAHHHP